MNGSIVAVLTFSAGLALFGLLSPDGRIFVRFDTMGALVITSTLLGFIAQAAS
ncbi:MAG: hypothetical protein KGL46_03950 [Hyphomicrobiales bacterium]|nr:hypothetical protein [Hyphomicrobiales bacterium]